MSKTGFIETYPHQYVAVVVHEPWLALLLPLEPSTAVAGVLLEFTSVDLLFEEFDSDTTPLAFLPVAKVHVTQRGPLEAQTVFQAVLPPSQVEILL